MLTSHQKLAIYMEGELTGIAGKMGSGILRYSPNHITCVVDSTHAGKDVLDVIVTPRSCPIVASIAQAREMGADVLVLGIAPPGGLLPPEWFPVIDEAVACGMSVVNGLHDVLSPRYPQLPAGQWIWDLRVEPAGLTTASGRAMELSGTRVLMIGTDMAVGKMTAGLELLRAAEARSVNASFVATGQIGITIRGSGIPLDAIRVDYASGAVEREVMRYPDAELIIVEGQGALCHPASTSTLPLMRGTMPTHLILCHRAGQRTLRRHASITIPPLLDYIRLYEDVGEVSGTFPRPRTVGIALNTAHLDEREGRRAVDELEQETGLPTTDPVRFGAEKLLDALRLGNEE